MQTNEQPAKYIFKRKKTSNSLKKRPQTDNHRFPLLTIVSLSPQSARRPTRACSSPTSTVAPGSTCCAWPAACHACRTCGCATAAKKTSCSTTGTTCCRPAWPRTRPSSSGRSQFAKTVLKAVKKMILRSF